MGGLLEGKAAARAARRRRGRGNCLSPRSRESAANRPIYLSRNARGRKNAPPAPSVAPRPRARDPLSMGPRCEIVTVMHRRCRGATLLAPAINRPVTGKKPSPMQIEQAVLGMLAARGAATACPSEIARALAPDDWRPLMDPVRAAAAHLQRQGRVDAYH